MTCGHHIVERSLSAYLRHHPFNIVPLCPKHHKFGNDIAAHSKNPIAVKKFVEWIKKHRPKSYELLLDYKKFRTEPYSYEEDYYEWKKINEDAEK